MTEVKDDDPFTWDVDRVVKELCTSDRTWRPTANAKLPDPHQLAARLREAEYDGEVLLSSLEHEGDLWPSLGVTAPKHKMALRTAIGQFQARSRQYQEYKNSLQYQPDDDMPSKLEHRPVPLASFDDVAVIPPASFKNGENEIFKQPVEEAAQRDAHNLENGGASEPPKKKQRRLASTQLTTVDQVSAQKTSFSAAPILTEADVILASRMDAPVSRSSNFSENIDRREGQPGNMHEKLLSRPGAFWGNGKLSSDDIVVLDDAVNDDKSFGFGQPIPFGRGRKKWVNGKMKKFLRTTRPSTDDDDESILPALGESDDDDNPEWQDIYREIEDEEEDVRREKEEALARTSELKPLDVDAFLGKMIDEHIALWQETKLPKLQRKAYSVWRKARRTGAIREIKRLSESLRATKTRLNKLLENLKDNVYLNEHELRRMGPILEPTIDEAERLKWHIAIVRSLEAPEKAPAGKKSTPAPLKTPVASSIDGIDIWSEAESAEFIVDDDSEDHGWLEDVARPLGNSPALSGAMDVDVPQASDTAAYNPAQSFGSMSDVTMYDLTEAGGSSKDPINLDTPVKPKPHRASSLLDNEPDSDKEPPLHAIHDISQKGIGYWEAKSDPQRLIIAIIAKLQPRRRKRTLEAVVFSTAEEVWIEYIVEAIKLQPVPLENLSKEPKDRERRDTAILLARLFDIFTGSCSSSAAQSVEKIQSLTGASVKRIEKQEHCFSHYYHFLHSLALHFGITRGDEDNELLLDDAVSDDSKDDLDLTPAQRSARKVKKQRIAQKQSALLREEENKEAEDKQVRRLLFRQNAQKSTLLPREKTRLIINESKLEGQGLIFVHDHIASRIKNHQIDGVRFMWDEITKDTKHGCLLAHTMGLGKTMQVITLLTAIAEAAKSDDETISCQVPEHLKSMKTLILAPAGILNNWVEELRRWAPDGLLGEIYYVEPSLLASERGSTIRAWGRDGGVLLMGYPLFRRLPGKHGDLLQILLNEPSLVIGDEAHHLKNQKASLSKLANTFKTRSRIALTGSPLSNSVEEYYSMINWISPGFLGNSDEFTLKYGQPIKDGLWKDASADVRRKAKIRLATLKKVVGPKVHRRTVAALKDSGLPSKKEFLIYLDLSEVQKNFYQVFVQGVLASSRNPLTGKLHVKSVWSLVSTLRLLLAHPIILHSHMQMAQDKAIRPEKRASSSSDDDTSNVLNAALADGSTEVLSNTLDALMFEQVQGTIDASYKMMALDRILEATLSIGDNVLVFSQSIPSLDFIESKLCREKHRAYKRLDGSTPADKRQHMVNEFNGGKQQVFLISTTAGGVGLNIYGANRVVIFDSKYNPLHEQQAIGRAYRMGQTKEVFVYWLLCDGTFERVMQNQQIFKNQLFSQVVDEKNPLPKADPNLRVWFKQYEEAPRQDTSNLRGHDHVLDALLGSEKLSSHISSIETTDTFEEEELDADLAADDQLEADRMAAEQTGKAPLPMPQQSHQVRQLSVLPSLSPVSSPSPCPSPPPSHQADHSADVADRGTAIEMEGLDASTPTTALHTSSEFQNLETTPAWMEDGLGRHVFPMTHPANTTKQAFPTASSRPFFSGMEPSVFGGPGAMPPSKPFGIMPAYTSTGSYGPVPNYAHQHLDNLSRGASWQQYQQTYDHPPRPTTAITASSLTSTDPRQQQQQFLGFPLGSNGTAVEHITPVTPFGSNGVANGQVGSSTPAQDARILSQSEATRPMMIGNIQERRTQARPSTTAEARNSLKTELMKHTGPAAAGRVEAALQEMEQHVTGELPRRQMWNKLAELVKAHPACAAALVDGRASSELLTGAFRTKNKDLVSKLLSPVPSKQDPNVRGPIS